MDIKKKKKRRFKTLLQLPNPQHLRHKFPHKKFYLLFYLLSSLLLSQLTLLPNPTSLPKILGTLTIILTLQLCYGLYLLQFHKKLLEKKLNFLYHFLFFLSPILLAKLLLLLQLPLLYLPLAFVSITFSIGYGTSLALANTTWISIYITLLLPNFHPLPILPLSLGAILGIYTFQSLQSPLSLRRLGFLIGLCQTLTYLATQLIHNPSLLASLTTTTWQNHPLPLTCALAFANGLACGILITETLPILEKIFHVATKIKLHKLADQNHPLLRQMQIVAPGTYHHSIMVGLIAEAAAEAIGANALETKVGGFFHDIGKMLKPNYYIENIAPDQQNKHDNLSPAMSTLIITAHPRDGVDMAKEYGLPQRIMDFMMEHHGTTLVKYFYQKAKNLAQETGEEVYEESFRYPGPKPQSKETAILSLADPVEAASRTLKHPTPASIQRLVDNIVNDRIQDGQLDECDINLNDLHIIKQTFVRMILNIFHGRIAYEQEEEKQKLNPQT